MAKAPKKTGDRSLWVPIIEAVKSPLAFMVLALLGGLEIMNVISARMTDPNLAFFGAIAWIFAFIVAMVGMAIWNIETLLGVRPLAEHAEQFAVQLYAGAEGAFRSLEPAERAEAWATLGDVIASRTEHDARYKEFCQIVSKRVKEIAKITDRKIKTQGVIEAGPNQ